MKTTTRVARVLTAAAAAVLLAAPAHADPRVGGDIGVHYDALGGAGGALGQPVGGEVRTPNARGAYVEFERGGIWWSPATGAREVRGEVLSAWGRTGWEAGPLGFPTTDETRTPDGRGAYNVFEGGSIYWSPPTGAHVLIGAIREAWAAQGHENGPLGFPTSSEFDVPGGKRVNFQGGYVEWSAATGARVDAPVSAPAPWLPPGAPAPSVPAYYPNCAAARAAGAAPLYFGQPGYRPALDGDGDGVACE